MTSIGGEGKSGDGKTRRIDKTFKTRGRAVEEEMEESLKKVTSAELK